MYAPDREHDGWSADDELRHAPSDDVTWREEWAFWFWSDDGHTGGYTGVTSCRRGLQSWYWAALITPEVPLLYLCDLDAPALRGTPSLVVKAEGLWADHDCEAPFEQWTVTNEGTAVILEDADEVFGRGLGTQSPMAFDIEWYAEAAPQAIPGGYEQVGTVNAVIERDCGDLHGQFRSRRTHRWGHWSWGTDDSQPGHRAPLFVGGRRIERQLDARGWREWVEMRAADGHPPAAGRGSGG
jgi:hypothetical protein